MHFPQALNLWNLHKEHKARQAAVAAQLLHETLLDVLRPATWGVAMCIQDIGFVQGADLFF